MIVDLVISARDSRPFLARTIESVRRHAPSRVLVDDVAEPIDLHVLVVDDGSVDGTPDECQRLGVEVLDTGRRVPRTPNGQSFSVNLAYGRTTGDVFVQQCAEVVHLTDCLSPLIREVAGKDRVAAFATVFDGPAAWLDLDPYAGGTFDPAVFDHLCPRVYSGLPRPQPYFWLGATSRAGFRPYPVHDGCSDWQLAQAMTAEKFRLVFCPSAQAYHAR